MPKSTKPTGWIEFEIVGNERGVEAMLMSINSALSPIGLAAFLHGGVGPWIQQRAAARFNAEGDDVSGKWAPLQEATVHIRETSGFGGEHPINKRTGELEAYITKGQINVTTTVGQGTLTYPGNPPSSRGLQEKMRTAQKGRTSPSTVARPVLGLNERDLSVIMTMLAFHIEHEGVRLGHVRP